MRLRRALQNKFTRCQALACGTLKKDMYRLKKFKQGWIVEIRKPYWTLFGIMYKWVHFNHYSGLPCSPFYTPTPEGAREVAVSQIESDINFSFYHFPD